ncbi:substrate-binding periplasmic protein [Chitinimonas sp. BJB300]|uniref:substrate-binding periplasmic protein n=1 Tax=Chitinimonas sp. BJB300 TaxID=1559339 RepID=UPI0013047686|nr:transporter substrate-binding domain-containing protein [Chitinimonas sp. BJB300]
MQLFSPLVSLSIQAPTRFPAATHSAQTLLSPVLNWFFRPLLLLGVLLFTTVQAAQLRICYEDIDQPPWTYLDGQGVTLDLLRKVANELGEEFQFFIKPWKRCLGEVKLGIVDAVVGAVELPERRVYSEYPKDANGKTNPSASLWHDDFNIFVLEQSTVEWDGQQFHQLNGQIAAQAGYSSVTWLKDQGLPVTSESKSAEEVLRLINIGVAEAGVIQGAEAVKLVQTDLRFKGKIRVLARPYRSEPLYFIVSKLSYAKAPARFDAIWQSIARQRQSPEYRAAETKARKAFLRP